MDYQTIKQQSGSQKEINKLFLKACKEDDIEMVKYLLTSDEIVVKAQLNITKKSGFSNDKKEGFYPLIQAVQYNSKKVYKYFLEEIDWFSTLSMDGKLEILGKGSYSNDVEGFDYLFKKFEQKTKINNYQKPYLLTKILESVIDKDSDKVFDYLMNLSPEYKEHINNKNDISFRRAAKSSPKMLEHMLAHKEYKTLFTELYLYAFEETKKNPISSMILFKYGLERNMFNSLLSRNEQSYIRDKVREQVFKTYHDSLIKYIVEENQVTSPEKLKNLINENVRDYFYTEDEYHKNKNDQKIAPVLEYVIKNKLLTKETREQILFDIVKHGYKNLMGIIAKYPQYGEGLNLNKVFIEALHVGSIGKDKYQHIIDILNIDIDRSIDVTVDENQLFRSMESIKGFNQNYDEQIKKVFVTYHFWPDEKLKEIYKNTPEMQKIVEMKELNMKLSNDSEKYKSKPIKKNKI